MTHVRPVERLFITQEVGEVIIDAKATTSQILASLHEFYSHVLGATRYKILPSAYTLDQIRVLTEESINALNPHLIGLYSVNVINDPEAKGLHVFVTSTDARQHLLESTPGLKNIQ